MKLDEIDLEIIEILRKNARFSIAHIARRLGMSANATRARYKKILKSGIIKQTFIPTYLPQYSSGESLTYKMQMIIRSTNTETEKLVKSIQEYNLEYSQIECWETVGHFNIFVWIISENPIDLALIKDRVQSYPGVLEVKVCFIVNMVDSYSEISLHHLNKREKNG
jgi:DNA-binding Lrp family transcriptional regulator